MAKQVKKGAEKAPNKDEAENINVEAVEVKTEPKAGKKSGYIVKKAFKDAPVYRVAGKAKNYAVGDDVSALDGERLDSLIKRGYVEKQG